MKNKFAICIFVSVISALYAVITKSELNAYKSNITEASFSLCGTALLSEASSDVKAEIIKNYLTFSDLSDDCKEEIAMLVRNDKIEKSFAQKMIDFEYSKNNIKKLENEIKNFAAMPAVKVVEKITSDELAKLLIEKIFNGSSKFNVETGNGKNYLRRYYCSNVLIDVCSDGIVRYLSGIEPNGEEDIFLEWLIEEEKVSLVSREIFHNMEYIIFSGSAIDVRMCYNPVSKRVVAAEITIK